MWVKVVALLAVLTFLSLASLSTSFRFFNRHQVASDSPNEWCRGSWQGRSARPQETALERREECERHPHRFTNFLWFVSDGLPARYSDRIFSFYSNHSVVMHFNVPGAKYSHAIYTSWLTGQLPTNYRGRPIEGDQLLKSLHRSREGIRLQYAGPEWSFLAVNGEENYQQLFSKIDIRHESLDISFRHAYPWWFSSKESKRGFYWDYLPSLVNDNASLIAHSAVFDHKQHGLIRNHGDERELVPYARTIAKDFSELKRFIDANPQYLLILSSDHGVDQHTISGYVMHGSSDRGNNGYVLLYNPRLPEGTREVKMDVVDVCPTLSSYLADTDIPMSSVGVSRAYFGSGGGHAYRSVLRQNVAQLVRNAEERGISTGLPPLNMLLSDKSGIGDLLETAEYLKYLLYHTLVQPWAAVYLYAVLCAGLLGALLYAFGRKCWAQAAVLMVGPFIPIFLPWIQFAKVFKSGSPFFLATGILALLTLKRSMGEGKEAFKAAASIVLNEIVNWTVLAVTLLFKQSWRQLFTFVPSGVFWVALWAVGNRRLRAHSVRVGRLNATTWWGCLVALVLLFENTEHMSPLYLVFGFHVVFAAIAAWLAFLCASVRSNLALVISLNVLLLMLWTHVSARLLVLLFNWQMFSLLVPSTVRLQHHFAKESSDTAKLLYVGCVAYCVAQGFYFFTVAFGERVNLDVHPYVGKLGMRSFDVYPALSGVWMAVHKYGVFFLMALYHGVVLERSVEADSGTMWQVLCRSHAWWCLVLMLQYFAVAQLAFHLILCWFASGHPVDESAVYCGLTALITATFCGSALHAAARSDSGSASIPLHSSDDEKQE